VTRNGSEGNVAGHVHPTSLKHDVFSNWWRMPHNAPDSLTEDSHLNSESISHLSKWTPTGPLRETLPNTREVVSDEDRHGFNTRAILAEPRDNLRETESVYLLSRLVGGGASLQLTLLCRKFPASVKYTGKIAIAARSFVGSSTERPIPHGFRRTPRSPPVRKNRELTGNDSQGW
jgi:hypothetical protein